MMWLKTHRNQQLEAGIRLRTGDGHSRGYAFEEAMVLYLLRKLRYSAPLYTIFDFHPKHTPSWANEEAHIVARLNGVNVPADVIGEVPQNPGLGVVHYAGTIEDVICWIETLDPAPAILIASDLFGADILIRVKLSSRIIILMGQSKSYTNGNKGTIDTTTFIGALNSLHPDHWFKKSEKDERQKLINTIKKHHVLRFVAGYPLLPNLTVEEAISAFDSSDALASINVDELRQHFKEPGILNVLEPVEEAYSKKRKASENELMPMQY
ncbi:hypothetical protein AX14_011619 [Amanita brunnescens Koide BX004]|nr:hypothetical protein AX14_011619 [Amanita brunnescens Koide BX004]